MGGVAERLLQRCSGASMMWLNFFPADPRAMNRKTLITIHMYLAAFFAPFVLLVCISGGLYLVGVKGEVQQESIYSQPGVALDTKSPGLKADVDRLLALAGVDADPIRSIV